jgi:outer membrane receptor protein involved in Fe transport
MKRSDAGFWPVLLVTLSLIFAECAYGQLGKGVVEGTVADPAGALVPNATVTLVNEGTGVSRALHTNAAGLYRFDFIDVGSYTLRVSAQGFGNYELDGLVVTVGQTVVSDVKLVLGKTATTVTVEASGVQLVNTANAEISGLVSRATIANLPLEIRDATAFVNLQPGAVPDAFNGSTRGAAVNGMRGGMGNFMVDGTDNNDYGQGGRSHNASGTIPGGIVSISPDAVQEFRVVTNNFSAEYGRQGGFVTDTVLKSGTNRIHGSAFEYNRNSATTANDFFTNKIGGSDQLIRNQFGGSLGGPVKKDKVFVFGALEFQRLRQTVPQTVTTVTQPFVNFVQSGQFANFANQNLSAFGLSAPIDCSNASNPGCSLGSIFQQLNSKYPLPFATSTSGNASASPIFPGPVNYPVPELGQATFPSKTILNETRWSVRYDQQISSNDTLSAHYLFDNFPATNSGIGGDFLNPGFPAIAESRSQNGAIGYTHIFTPTVLNEFKASYLRSSAGFPATAPEIPSIGTFDALSVGFGSSSALPQKFTENTFQYQDSLAITHGRHSFKVGGEYRRTRNGSFFDATVDGLYELWDTEDLLTDGAIGDLTGNGGFGLSQQSINPSSLTPAKPDPYRGYRGNELGWYVEDNWKVKNNVTLNLGLRYDYFGIPHNFRPGIDSNFYFGSPALNQCIIKNSTGKQVCFPTSGATNPLSDNPYFPVDGATANEFSGAFQVRSSGIWNKDTNNFAPRFGLAWDVRGNQKTLVRLGGGVFYDRMWNNLFENIRFNPPFWSFSSVGPLANGTIQGPISTPGFYSIPINVDFFVGSGGVPSPRHMDQNLVTAYSEQVNFDLQQQLANNLLLDVAYVGSFGHKLTGVVDLNTFDGRTISGVSHSRINPNIGADNARGNYYNSNYHALQARLTKRFSRGVQFDANYTWSHALDFVSDAFNNKAGGDYHPEDNYNRSLEYGNADFDIRHRFVGDWVWDLPVLRQNKWLEGWSLNGTLIWQSGSPFTVFDSAVDSNHDGHFNDRGTYIGGGNISNAIDHSQSPADGYLKANMFVPTTGPTNVPVDGLLARNALFGPAYFDTDLSIAKNFKFSERVALRVIVSGFNIWNHQSFLIVPLQGTQQGGDIANPLFGQAPQTVQPNNTGTGGRVLQFGARIDF